MYRSYTETEKFYTQLISEKEYLEATGVSVINSGEDLRTVKFLVTFSYPK
jgi:hypothetical protein